MSKKGFAIVTGSARGLGVGMVLQLAEEGYDVVINYTSSSSAPLAEAVAEKARGFGVGAIVVQGSVEDYDQCEKIVQAGVDAFGDKIAVLVNNAGIAGGTMFKDLDPKAYKRMVDIHLIGTMNCSHIVIPYMVKANIGCIINISSVCGIMGVPGQADYSAAKAGVIGFTKALAKELGGFNIRVNCIAPGMIATEMVAAQPKEAVDALKAITPLGCLGEVEDIAECMSYIVSAKFLTGQTISPNGGLTI